MALVRLSGSGNIWLPNIDQASNSGTPATRAGDILDAVGEQYGIIFEPHERNVGKVIDKIGLRLQTITASDSVDARLETINLTNGQPSGTLATTNSNLSQVISSNGWNEWALTAGHTIANSTTPLGVVIEIPTGSTANIRTGRHRYIHTTGIGLPYQALNIGVGGYVKAGLGENLLDPSLCVGFSDGTWENICGSTPIASIGSDALSSTGTPEAGLEFQIPFKAIIAAGSLNIDTLGEAFDLHLGNGSYNPGDTGATRLATRSIDAAVMYDNGNALTRGWGLGSEVDLSIDTTYRLTCEATTATGILMYYMNVDSSGLLSALPHGTTWSYIVDNGAGGWTKTTTRVPLANIGLSKLDNGVGGGGGGGGAKLTGIGGGLAG